MIKAVDLIIIAFVLLVILSALLGKKKNRIAPLVLRQ